MTIKNNHIQHILSEWQPLKDDAEWVAGFIYKTEGPCYRKTGALMLFGSHGEQLGLLSGGCLEADLMRKARQVMQTQQATTICYDASDDNDISYQLGIGCGGIVYIALLPINKTNNYLSLHQLLSRLEQRQHCTFTLGIPPTLEATVSGKNSSSHEKSRSNEQFLTAFYEPLPHLMIVGAGIDARPLAQLALDLGWLVSLCDSRPANARPEHFSADIKALRDLTQLGDYCTKNHINAAVVMTHNLELDAAALKQLKTCELNYVGLLGPPHRKQQVVDLGDIIEADFKGNLFGPAGLNIGGELPEYIALSILAQCQQVLSQSAQKA